jgi:pimeloyl-ACP methyl ester carboxylesterase
VIAPDWRGFGLTGRTGTDTYWFPDYFADLDAILDHYAPDEAVDLVGHSMGGNIASVYAGVRPARVARLVNLEGFGLPASRPEQFPERVAHWLDELKSPPTMRAYATLDEVAARLVKTNPRLPPARAAFLASHWAAHNAAGQWEILGDPAHKMAGPLLYRVEEILACWRRIAAPVLWVEAEETDMWRWLGPKEVARAEVDRRMAEIPKVTPRMVPEAGHMLHHDQPVLLASMIEDFLGA